MRVAVGLSGGVDSAVAALLLKEQGHEVTAVTMRFWRGRYPGGAAAGCFGPDEPARLAEAAAAAERLGLPHRTFDVGEAYERDVVDYFRATSLAGHTPNPCVRCNERVKFGLLPRLAREAGLAFDRFATGHYARIVSRGGRFAVSCARDRAKDQSYFLYRLSQEQLAHQLFPLGDLTKDEVRAFARARGLAAADRRDSQDFYTGDADDLIGEAPRRGNIVDVSGRVLGTHTGFWHYTVGQRRGLGIGGGVPYFVVDLNACRNEVVVGHARDAVATWLETTDVVYGALSPGTKGPVLCRVKVRSAGEPRAGAVLEGARCSFPDGISGVAPGQSAVFYAADADEILAGGVIARAG